MDSTNGWFSDITLPGASGAVRAFHTSRGSSADGDPYSGFSICHYVGDDPGSVAACRRELCAVLGIGEDRLVVPGQTHSVNVATVTNVPFCPENTDALVTSMRGVAIGVSTADCVPLVLADVEAGVIGAAHAGWRGALGDVVGHTVKAMEALGAVPRRISAALGPCICAECFEVGEEVAALFPAPFVLPWWEKPHVDLPGYVMARLMSLGVARDNIVAPDGCTRCRPDVLFSARALGAASGRLFTGIVLGA